MPSQTNASHWRYRPIGNRRMFVLLSTVDLRRGSRGNPPLQKYRDRNDISPISFQCIYFESESSDCIYVIFRHRDNAMRASGTDYFLDTIRYEGLSWRTDAELISPFDCPATVTDGIGKQPLCDRRKPSILPWRPVGRDGKTNGWSCRRPWTCWTLSIWIS